MPITTKNNQEPPRATKYYKKTQNITKKLNLMPRITKNNQKQIKKNIKKHHEPTTITKNHQKPQRTTKNHKEPQKTTMNNQEPPKTTKN